MRLVHFPVTRTARYAVLGEPDSEIREVWIACHGHGQLAGRFIRRFTQLADGSRLIVAPEALSRYYLDNEPGPHGPESRVGATWMTREDRLTEIRDYVGYLDALHDHIVEKLDRDAVRLVAFGFSQGAATANRWSTMGHARVDRLILWGSFMPPDLDLAEHAERMRAMDVILVSGEADPFAGPAAAAKATDRLREHEIEHRLVTYPGGHRVEPETLRKVATMEWKGA